jgi:CHAT domain-containing protein
MTADGSYLVEHRAVSLAISATLLVDREESGRPGRRETTVVAFADPALPRPETEGWRSEALRSRLRDTRLVPLPATRVEAETILRLYPEHARAFMGDDATEERARELSPGVTLVHFGCHGYVDESSPLSSGLILSNPRADAVDASDGVLEAWEVLESVRIDADLVTLSGCDTGMGRAMGGEGMVGLTRAFQFAGARAVVASLWTVADESTAALMQRFYAHLHGGKPTAEALRAAQVELIERPVEAEVDGEKVELDYSHPFRWAAFRVVGGWR